MVAPEETTFLGMHKSQIPTFVILLVGVIILALMLAFTIGAVVGMGTCAPLF